MYLEMLCKESIVTWFKDLTSFKRIDVMCNLLQTCQPFETRFLGTCIEELGRKDFALLRQIENIVNNPAELSSQDLNNINDKETRSKISQFLCVLHSTNKRCANEMYNILVNLYEDVNNIIKSGALYRDDSPLDDLLLIYALGIFHPAFSFDKKLSIGDLLIRLLQEEERIQIFKQKEMLSPENYSSDNVAMSQLPDTVPNPGSDEAMLNSLPVLSYPPVLPSVMSHMSSPSGSPPIRTKPPGAPISPNPRLMNESELPPPALGMPPPGVKESRLLTNGKPNEELWLQANIRRQSYVMPVFYAPSPPTPNTPSTCSSSAPVTPSTCSSCHNGGPPVTSRALTSPPAPGPGYSVDVRLAGDQRLMSDQMRELRLGEIPFPGGTDSHYSPGQSSSGDSNTSDPAPPSPPPHDIGRVGLPPVPQYNSRCSSRGSNMSLGAPGSSHQYRRRAEMNGHDPGPIPTSDNFYPVLNPQPTFLPPPPQPAYPMPMYPPGTIFPEALMLQYPPGPPPNLAPAMYGISSMPAPPRTETTSCYNCGSQSHVAPECPDPTIDEVSKQGQYRLDYEGSTGQFTNVNDIN